MPKTDHAGWGDYTKTFSTDWYMKDYQGNPIGVNGSGKNNITGYLLDLTNPEYQAWALATVTDWMRQAPFAGVKFDNTNIMHGNKVNMALSNINPETGKIMKMNEMLCGPGAPVNADGDCDRVVAWNNGLRTILSNAVTALHAMNKEVYYNGIAESPLRGEDRNLSLLAIADGAMNENFCYVQTIETTDRLDFTSLLDDIHIMQQEAAAGKKIIETTNHHNEPSKLALNGYCFGGFLMGWQPGYDFYDLISGYNIVDNDIIDYPRYPELDLNLGNPTAQYQQSGTVLTRAFENGYVAINMDSSKPGAAVLPFDLTEFKNGAVVGTYQSGETIAVGPLEGRFFLKSDFLNPPQQKTPDDEPPSNPSKHSGGSVVIGSRPVTGGSPYVDTTDQTFVDPNTPATITVQSDKSLDKPVSKTVQFTAAQKQAVSAGSATPNADATTVTKIDYSLDQTQVHTVETFPDTWALDTTTLTNDWHTLAATYTYGDGTTRQSISVFKVENGVPIFVKAESAVSGWWRSIMAFFKNILSK
jgi:hypothetical protein